ncbi:MAG: branched-chain amino acid transaminase, partial [Acidovorax sp.]|nr:branched-chain amino acid transaminase [Acidovorax sp.]
GTAIFRLQEHTERLMNSAKILRMKLPFTAEQLNQAQIDVVKANKLESCYLRPLVWIGDKKLGVSPKGNTIHAMVAAWAWGAYLGEEGLKRGIRVKTSSYTRHHVNITMTQAKAVSNYSNSILANMEATDDGYDEALLLDSAGFVSEGAGENIFVVKNGVIYTPDLSAGALNGITRNTVFHIAKDLGLEIVQKRITRDEVYIADEAFFTGTAAEVTPIRELMAETNTAKERGYGPGRFSFNVAQGSGGGRCEACQGDGVVKVEMHFLPDVYVPCDVCHGQRYNRETLEVQWKGRNIAQILELTVEDAHAFFKDVPAIARKLQTLLEVGLSYIRLGQSATTLSGGEAQRVKLAQELSRRDTGRTLYILDEPTTGLHFADIDLLLRVLHQLRDAGNTIIVIEHNLDVIKTADWVIDMGPEGG